MGGDNGSPSGRGSELAEEGKCLFPVTPSGGRRGPGRREGVFFNPAMVQNRDLSVLVLQYLLDSDSLPGRDKRVLDGLTGCGARAIRLASEVKGDLEITGLDIDPSAVETANEGNRLNSTNVRFAREDVKGHLSYNRYSYIDIDPFGTPVEFLPAALGGLLNGGILGITATDTAALTGSVPRVARRRYGTKVSMTHFYQELSCRVLMGHIARLAASLERGTAPLFFYSSDHFVRGYLKVIKGAKRADSTLKEVGYISYREPFPPSVVEPLIERDIPQGEVMGPLWTGPLEDEGFVRGIISTMESDKGWNYLGSYVDIRGMLQYGLEEANMPLGGFDLNTTSKYLRTSPPKMVGMRGELERKGFRFSRSRFSPTIFKTDGKVETVLELFGTGGGGNRWYR